MTKICTPNAILLIDGYCRKYMEQNRINCNSSLDEMEKYFKGNITSINTKITINKQLIYDKIEFNKTYSSIHST